MPTRPTQLAKVEQTAFEALRWGVVAIFQAPHREGHVPRGAAVVLRPNHPLGTDRQWAVVNWADRGNHVDFYSGDYDLTWGKAISVYLERLEGSSPGADVPIMDLRAAYPALALIHESEGTE